MAKIGVFICWCGENIGRSVDCAEVAKYAMTLPGVVFATDYKYVCSDPGQKIIKEAIKDNGLTGVVCALCSPKMHETTFQRVIAEAGLNSYQLEIANLREHCSWVHDDPTKKTATPKAKDLVRIAVEKVKRNTPLFPIEVPITKRAVVIGGGISGIQAALDIAATGHEVVLVEREASIGGHMAQLSETFPTLDCSQCILTPKMVDVAVHPRIRLLAYSEIEKVTGFIGNFEITIRRKATYVDHKTCTGCGACTKFCPVAKSGKVLSEFDTGLGTRGAIYVPFAQAVPNKPVIDRSVCTKLLTGKCGICAAKCPKNCINFKDEDRLETIQAGAVVVATGYDMMDSKEINPEYGGGRFKDVIDGLQFERLASASGPTGGEIFIPSTIKTEPDGKVTGV
ncbi:MAG: 4Fe-4S dicluster domain-containing protein, partial [Candidatus Brocadiia bacterium]